MTDEGATLSLWLADIAANLLCVVILLLAIRLHHAGEPAVQVLPVTPAVPMSGAQMVEMLRLRLAEPAAAVEVTAEGLRRVSEGEAGALRLYVLDARGYGDLASRLMAERRGWDEISVPEALQTPDRSAFTPEFLALDPDEPDRFRRELTRLLTRAGEGRAAPAAAGPSRLAILGVWGRALVAALLSALALWLWRRGVRSAAAAGQDPGSASRDFPPPEPAPEPPRPRR